MSDAIIRDADAEDAVLGAIIMSPAALAVVRDSGLTADDFYLPSHQAIYQAAIDMAARGEPVETISLTDELRRTGKLEAAGGKAAVHTLAATVPAATNAKHYARIVMGVTHRRRFATAADAAADAARNGGVTDEHRQALLRALEPQKASAADRYVIESWEAFRNATPPEVGWIVDSLIPSGGSVGFTGAGPKSGKTWLDLLLAICVAAGKPFLDQFIVPQPLPVVCVLLEGSRSNVRDRIGALARGLGLDPDGADHERAPWPTAHPPTCSPHRQAPPIRRSDARRSRRSTEGGSGASSPPPSAPASWAPDSQA